MRVVRCVGYMSTTVGAYSSGSVEKSHLNFLLRLSRNFNPLLTRSGSTFPFDSSRAEKKDCMVCGV